MKTVHYASYLVNGAEVSGTAALLAGGYLFRAEGARTATLVASTDADLVLNGRCFEADAQHDIDLAVGGYAAVACGREEGRS
jgi:hypothetical protein